MFEILDLKNEGHLYEKDDLTLSFGEVISKNDFKNNESGTNKKNDFEN